MSILLKLVIELCFGKVPTTSTVDLLGGRVASKRNLVGSYLDHGTILEMELMNPFTSVATCLGVEHSKVRKLKIPWTGDFTGGRQMKGVDPPAQGESGGCQDDNRRYRGAIKREQSAFEEY
jgi:hypothetical protein